MSVFDLIRHGIYRATRNQAPGSLFRSQLKQPEPMASSLLLLQPLAPSVRSWPQELQLAIRFSRCHTSGLTLRQAQSCLRVPLGPWTEFRLPELLSRTEVDPGASGFPVRFPCESPTAPARFARSRPELLFPMVPASG